MARLIFVLAAIALLLCGCKTIEGGYETNKEKQNAKTDKMMSDSE